MVDIEHDIPIPQHMKRLGRKPIYPFLEMKPGDSFFWPLLPEQKASAVQQAISNSARLRGFVVKTRQAVRDDTVGIRVWLLA